MDFSESLLTPGIFDCGIMLIPLLMIYYFIISKKPEIYTGNAKLFEFLTRHLPIVKNKYWPSFFFLDGRLQTIFGLSRTSASEKLNYKRNILTMKDGGKVALDFLSPNTKLSTTSDSINKLIVILLPGVICSSQTPYIKAIVSSIVNYTGSTVAVLNNRGLAGVPLLTPKGFCATDCEDLREAIAYLKLQYPDTNLMAIGTSLGGMILSHYLIKYSTEAEKNLTTAMLISIVWDAWSAMSNLESPINLHLLNHQLAQNYLQMVKKYQHVFDGRINLDFTKILESKTMRHLDEHFVAPQFGYKSLKEYYDHVTVANEINKFSIPVICLNAYDDPMSPGKDLPMKKAMESAKLALVVTNRGGHLGFLEGLIPGKKKGHFMERFIVQYVRAVRLFSKEIVECNSK